MTIKIKATDTFMDGRTGLLHAGQETTVNQSTADDLVKAGLVRIMAEKKITAPENKMIKKGQVATK